MSGSARNAGLVRLGLHYTWVEHGSKISLLLSGRKTGAKIPKTHKLNNYSLSTGRKNTIKWEKQRSKHTAISLINVCRTAMYFKKHSYLQTLCQCFTFMAYSWIGGMNEQVKYWIHKIIPSKYILNTVVYLNGISYVTSNCMHEVCILVDAISSYTPIGSGARWPNKNKTNHALRKYI